MSFGYGIGDFLAVSRLALDVYSACKDAPEDFRNILHEIKSLHIIVDRHKDEFRDKTLSVDEERQLREILQGCTNVLEDLDKLRIKYMSLGLAQGSSAQAIDRIKWSQENIVELRARLTSNTTLLNTFITSRTHTEVVAGQAGLLSSLEEIKNQFFASLRRKKSTMSLQSNSSFASSVKTKVAMKQLCKHLYKAGVRADMIRDREDQAAAFFQSQNTPPVPVPQAASSEIQKEELLEEEKQKGKNKRITRGLLLNMAASTGFRQGVQPLLCNVEGIETVLNDFGIPPLDTAAREGRTDVVRLLLDKGANIEATRSDDGSTALHSAAYSGHADVVRLLLEKGANIDATRSSDGATALDSAAYSGHADVVRLLLETGANIEATRSDDESTALNTAAYSGHADVVRLLLEMGANIEATRSDVEFTALHSAAYSGYADVVRLLLENGANIEATRSSDGATALDSAAYSGHAGVVRLLLEKGANIEATRSSDGATALDSAAYSGHAEVVRLLLEKGANIEATRSDVGFRALHSAAYSGHADVVRLLLEKGANIHSVTTQGETALHLVFYVPVTDYGRKLKDPKQLGPTIKLLLAHGSNFLQKNYHGQTPLDLAEKGGYSEAQYLFLYSAA